MIDRLEAWLRNSRRRISRSEWSIRRLGLAVSEQTEAQPGLVLIHIEGLSFEQFRRAVGAHQLPFSARLLSVEGYRVQTFGHASNLDSLERELFYGGSADAEGGSTSASSAGELNGQPQAVDEETALLAGGSQYACGLSGGAAHVHFQHGKLRDTSLLEGTSRAVRTGLIVGHSWSLARAAWHFGVATVSALARALAGRLSLAEFRRQLRAVTHRTCRTVLLRDLAAAGAALDVTRGLPIVAVSLLADTEPTGTQDLVRNPRALARMDQAIKQIWLAARRSPRRDYDVWIYSSWHALAAQAQGGQSGDNASAALALLPADAPVREAAEDVLRPLDLRRAALHHLGRGPLPAGARPPHVRVHRTLRVMTYNVHSCIGMDGKLSPERIARVIARCDADVVALQELDVRRMRTRAVDQAHAIAELLSMEFHFHPALALEEELYGDAILSRLPLRLVRAGGLPGLDGRNDLEPRGAIWVEIETEQGPVQLINTHLGLVAAERMRQAESLLGNDWLAAPECQGPTILCGDFNALPRSKVCRTLCARLSDAQAVLEGHRPKHTFFSRVPIGRIDHVFVSAELEVVAVEVPRDDLIRRASDHLPLVVELQLRGPVPAVRSARALASIE